jgi:hypothetical protein
MMQSSITVSTDKIWGTFLSSARALSQKNVDARSTPESRTTFEVKIKPKFTMAVMRDADLDAVYAFAMQLGKDAGEMLMAAAVSRYADSAAREHLNIEEKENAVDIVTETDEGARQTPELAIRVVG